MHRCLALTSWFLVLPSTTILGEIPELTQGKDTLVWDTQVVL